MDKNPAAVALGKLRAAGRVTMFAVMPASDEHTNTPRKRPGSRQRKVQRLLREKQQIRQFLLEEHSNSVCASMTRRIWDQAELLVHQALEDDVNLGDLQMAIHEYYTKLADAESPHSHRQPDTRYRQPWRYSDGRRE